MSCLSWNYRGLGLPQTVHDLHLMVKEKKPKLLFLMETKLMNKSMQRVKYKLGFLGMFTMDPVGRMGGLAFFW